jgi:hypothetical protein
MEELPENIADAPEIPIPSAAKPQKKKPRGRPITSENAKQMAISAAKAKKMRKEARAKMLAALTNDLDLGKELLKAMKGKDEKYLGMIEKATRLVGLQHDQSEDAIAQKISLNAKTDANVNARVELPNINITFEDAKPEER